MEKDEREKVEREIYYMYIEYFKRDSGLILDPFCFDKLSDIELGCLYKQIMHLYIKEYSRIYEVAQTQKKYIKNEMKKIFERYNMFSTKIYLSDMILYITEMMFKGSILFGNTI